MLGMDNIERQWRAVAEGQMGVISTSQLRLAGLTHRQIEGRAAGGVLVPVHRGVYRVGGTPETWHQAVRAACLATGGVASRRCAAALWRLRGCEAGVVEVTVPRRRQSELAGVLCHATDRLDLADMTIRTGIPVSTPARTLLDLGACVRPGAVERAMEDALHSGLVTVAQLLEVLQRVGRRGRNGTGVLRELLRERIPGQPATESPLEDDLVGLLRRASLPEPRRQYELRLPDGRTIRLDIAFPVQRVAIEVQGFLWHAGREDLQRDCDRHNWLRALGWTVLAFTSQDIRKRPGRTVELVWRAISGAQRTSQVHSAPENVG